VCGIAGFVSFTGARPAPWLRERVARMLGALAHRGPDDEGVFVSADGRVALGHRRLSIIDLSPAGHQPMATPDGRGWLVFNGELFDHRARRSALGDYPFRSHTDSEVLLALLHRAREPAEILPRLDAMFALAYYDAHRGTLLLARDHFGIKPLCYAVHGGGLWFASEPQALAASGELTLRLDPADFALKAATRMEAEGDTTWFAGVRQVPPAHYLEVDPARGPAAPRRYWIPDPRDADVEPAQVHDAFLAAVRARQDADVPRAAFLSGGLDSSAIVSALADLAVDVLPCIVTYQPDHAAIREDVAHARLVADWKRLPYELVEVRADELLALTAATTARVARPSVHGAELGMYCAYRRIAELGRTVVFSGHGADETWGYQDGLYFPILAPSFRPDMHSEHYLRKRLYQDDPPGWYGFLRRWLLPALGVTDAQVEEAIWERALAAYRELDTIDPHKRARYHMCRRFLVYVNHMVDALSMAWSLEDRPVFQDLDLVQLSFSTPEYRKNREGPTSFKPFLKQALRPLLPEEVILRPKVGFQPPIHDALRQPCLEALGEGLPFDLAIPAAELAQMPFTQLFFLLSTRIWLERFALDTIG
jgi:asparagine synthase (glutamine-hydrolysing)